jgi:16S rRNA (guanine966-N2)-methyltransferase
VRIIGGAWRSRVLQVVDQPELRPTPDRVRETLFNWLGPSLDGKTCLDLFAGSGALGFEALSRGARQVVMVEKNRVARLALQDNAKRLGATRLEIVHGDALQYLRESRSQFDVVFLDPPFASMLLAEALGALAPRLVTEGVVYVESEIGVEPNARWQVRKSGRAGNVKFQLLQPALRQAA